MVWPLSLLASRKKAELISGNKVIELREEQIEIGRGKVEGSVLEVLTLDPSGRRITIADNLFAKRISHTHAILTWDRKLGKYRFKDTSTNGSTVNGITVHRAEITLENKAKIEFPGIKFQIIYS